MLLLFIECKLIPAAASGLEVSKTVRTKMVRRMNSILLLLRWQVTTDLVQYCCLVTKCLTHHVGADLRTTGCFTECLV